MVLSTQIARDQERFGALAFDKGAGLLGVAVFVEIGNGDMRPLAGEKHGHGAPDTTVTAGDEGHLAAQLAHAGVARLIIGRRVHAVFVSGHPTLRLRREAGVFRHGSLLG